MIEPLQVLRVLGLCVVALLGGLAMAIGFVVLLGQVRFWHGQRKWKRGGR